MNPASGPVDGLNWKPNVSGNSVRWNGSSVVKSYDKSRVDHFQREHALLTRLAGRLPLPQLLPGSRPGELCLAYVDGVNGREAIETVGAAKVLAAMGRFLRELHDIDPRDVQNILPGDGPVIVHGDFAHYNVLIDEGDSRLLAVLDWEVATLGNAVADLAWCEWQFRFQYPQHAWALPNLFNAYGDAPAASVRQEAMMVRLEELNRGVRQRH